MSHYTKWITQNLSDKNPLSSSDFPHCHLRLAVNLRWTCQLSSLITDRPTCFPTNRPRVPRKDTPPFSALLLLHSLSPVRIRKHLEEPEDFVELHRWSPPVSKGVSRLVSSSSWLSGHSAALLSVIGCGRATEAPSQTVNNYRDVRATWRRAALTAVTHTQGTVGRWRSVRSCFMILLPTMNYGLSYELKKISVM